MVPRLTHGGSRPFPCLGGAYPQIIPSLCVFTGKTCHINQQVDNLVLFTHHAMWSINRSICVCYTSILKRERTRTAIIFVTDMSQITSTVTVSVIMVSDAGVQFSLFYPMEWWNFLHFSIFGLGEILHYF